MMFGQARSCQSRWSQLIQPTCENPPSASLVESSGRDIESKVAVEEFFRDSTQWSELINARVVYKHVAFA